MENNPLVSVVIPMYNAGRYITQAVDSVLAQTYRPIEILVVDDGSTDDSAAILQAYGSRIRYLHQKNQGQSIARNRGITESQGELVAFLDADDFWLPDKIARQVDSLSRAPRAGLAHTDVLFLENSTGQRSHRPSRKAEYVGNCSDLLFRQNKLTISSVLLRKECLTQVGLFDGVFRYTDDYDMWLRIAPHYEFCYVDEPLVIYRLHHTNISRCTLEMTRDELYVLDKALRQSPSYRSVVGPRQVRHRQYEVLAFLGYLYYAEGNYSTAHHYLSRALRLKCPDLYTTGRWALTLFPEPMVGFLRHFRRSLVAGVA